MIWLLLIFWLCCFLFAVVEGFISYWGNLDWYSKNDINSTSFVAVRWLFFFLLLFLVAPIYVGVSIWERVKENV